LKSQRDAAELRPGLLEADDGKIRRVLAVVDGVADPAMIQALLDTMRPRLMTLRPVRPLRFARLLFIPLEPLTVPLRGWRPGDPTVPRPILASIGKTVRARLGDLAPVIDRMLAGRNSDAVEAISQAGEILWPRAAEILTAAPPPADWIESGLPLAAYKPLAACIAAIFRRAPRLRSLALNEAYGALAGDEGTAADILENIASEPEVGCAMIARLILVQSPRAARLLRRIAGSGRSPDENAVLRRAMDRGMEAVLSQMERSTAFVQDIGNGILAEVAGEVSRVTTLLREIEADTIWAGHWPRLKGIRNKLDDVTRTRFARGVRDGLVGPLITAPGPIAGAEQTALESCARNLRKLEMAAPKAGGSTSYDGLLRLASDAVVTAAEAGILTPMRTYRLIEILVGPDAAEAMYLEASGRG
jgi:hypothetical protein